MAYFTSAPIAVIPQQSEIMQCQHYLQSRYGINLSSEETQMFAIVLRDEMETMHQQKDLECMYSKENILRQASEYLEVEKQGLQAQYEQAVASEKSNLVGQYEQAKQACLANDERTKAELEQLRKSKNLSDEGLLQERKDFQKFKDETKRKEIAAEEKISAQQDIINNLQLAAGQHQKGVCEQDSRYASSRSQLRNVRAELAKQRAANKNLTHQLHKVQRQCQADCIRTELIINQQKMNKQNVERTNHELQSRLNAAAEEKKNAVAVGTRLSQNIGTLQGDLVSRKAVEDSLRAERDELFQKVRDSRAFWIQGTQQILNLQQENARLKAGIMVHGRDEKVSVKASTSGAAKASTSGVAKRGSKTSSQQTASNVGMRLLSGSESRTTSNHSSSSSIMSIQHIQAEARKKQIDTLVRDPNEGLSNLFASSTTL